METDLDYEIIRQEAKIIITEMENWRNELNAIPELGLNTPLTSQYIKSVLKDIDVKIESGYAGGYGLVAKLQGENVGRTIALRAEMDALPGVNGGSAAHLCGHDGHMAIALGVLKLLKKYSGLWNGVVKILFQPGEEGPGGARLMLKEGAIEGVDNALAIHLDPQFPTGVIAIRQGQLNAYYDIFKITFKGKGGHGAYPHQANDPILASAYYIVGVQQLVSRNVEPYESVVVSLGKIQSGKAPNVIPSKAHLEGSIRCLTKQTKELLHQRLNDIGNGVALQCGVDFEIDIANGYPPVINDQDLSIKCSKILSGFFGNEVVQLKNPLMGSDDFSYISQEVPSLLIRLGCAFSDRDSYPLHSPHFNFQSEVLAMGFLSVSALIVNLMK